MPGADGIVAANYMYSVASKDGTIFAGLQGTVPFEPLLGAKEATFDSNKFNWLGSPSEEICVLVVRAGVPVDSYKDLKSHEIAVGTSSTNSNPAFFARLLNQVLGTKLKLVFGYPGQNDVFLAMERGEVDGHSCVYYSSLRFYASGLDQGQAGEAAAAIRTCEGAGHRRGSFRAQPGRQS